MTRKKKDSYPPSLPPSLPSPYSAPCYVLIINKEINGFDITGTALTATQYNYNQLNAGFN